MLNEENATYKHHHYIFDLSSIELNEFVRNKSGQVTIENDKGKMLKNEGNKFEKI